MEHIEQAGVHSGDSACSLPPYSLSKELQDELRRQTVLMAKALNVVGLMNVQFAVKEENGKDVVYVLEVNPRASRTVPFVSKATGRPLAKIAARCMAGQSLASQGIKGEAIPPYFSVKEAVFPFNKFPGVDTILGPEMKSTGEVMGVGYTFAEAFEKSQLAASTRLPLEGTVFLSVKNTDKAKVGEVAQILHSAGFKLVATKGTASAISAVNVPVETVKKVQEGRPNIVDQIKDNQIALVINTVEEKRGAIADSSYIRRAAQAARLPIYTTIAGAKAAALGIADGPELTPYALQALLKEVSIH
jgi:carbamoyl-phosphate synthase large subunit